MTAHQLQQQHDVEVPAVHHSEASHEILQKPRTKKNEDNLLRDMPERLKGFTENLKDEGA